MSGRSGARAALGFLTPLGGARAPEPGALDWFPAVGALVGLLVGAAWWAGGEIWNAQVAAAIAVVADLVLTGALHVDGVADTADGVLPHMERRRRLEVMAAPDVGAFGVAAAGSVLLLRFAAFTSLAPDALAIAALWCASRTAMAVTARAVPYARAGGLAQAFIDGSDAGAARRVAAVGAALAGVLAALAAGAAGVAGVVAVAGVAAAVVALARRRLGGFTGDVLGAAGVIGETVGLLVIAAW